MFPSYEIKSLRTIRASIKKDGTNSLMATPATNMASNVSAEEIRQALHRISMSKYFSHAPKKQKFVQLICDYYLQGRAAELNEYLIGCEVFEKGTGYNPSVDPVVRVGAHDVRKKLELYYQNEGGHDHVRIQIPIGTYVPVFIKSEPFALSEEVSEPIPAQAPVPEAVIDSLAASSFSPRVLSPIPVTTGAMIRRVPAKWLWVAVSLLLSLLVIGQWFYIRTIHQQMSGNGSSGALSRFGTAGIWQPFLSNHHSIMLVLSNPVVYRAVNGADPDKLAENGVKLTADQANLLTSVSNNRLPMRSNLPILLVPAFNMYTGIGEAVGAYRLNALLQGLGEKTILKQSRNVGPEDLQEHDIVMLGSVYSNQWSKPQSLQENFAYSSHASIENLSPLAGEAREYSPRFDPRTGALVEDYALITVVPGVSQGSLMMFLSGIYSEGTQAAAEYVTDEMHLSELNLRIAQLPGNPTVTRSFQVLLKVRVENSFPTQTSLLAIRELTP